MRVLGIIPARGGSRGIPNKNLQPINGIPLISHTIAAGLNSRALDRVIVSTDSRVIAEVAVEAGVEVPFHRPPELASDTATLDQVVRHALNALVETEAYSPDAYAILQPTNPFRSSAHIDEAVALMDSRRAGSVVSVSPPKQHPAEMATFDNGSINFPFVPDSFSSGNQRQAYRPCLFINGAIYLCLAAESLARNTRLVEPVTPYVMSYVDGFDIDDEEDLLIAGILMRERAKESLT